MKRSVNKEKEPKVKRKKTGRLRKITSFTLALLMLVLSVQTGAEAQKEKLPVLTTDGIFQCDWFDESILYEYDYSDNLFLGSAYEYNHDLALYALCVSMASFNSFDKSKTDEHIKKMLNDCGYGEFKSYGYETEGYDTIALAVGRKDVVLGGEPTTILIAAVRSGNYGMEWGGNVRIGTGETHEGFEVSKDILMLYLNEYFKDFTPYGKVKILIPGYSRGSSIANLFAAELIDGSYVETLGDEQDNIAKAQLKPENIYTYLYEAPQCTSDKNANNELYWNIFNIINPSDYVPMFVMDNYEFTLYGRKLYLPSASRCDNYDDYYFAARKKFDDFMAHTGKTSGDFFYSYEDSLSCEAIFNNLFSSLASDVMLSREYYVENLEQPMIYFAGQYLGKKRTVADATKTISTAMFAAVLAANPLNDEKNEDGYIAYIADYVEASTAGGTLTDKEIEGFFDLIVKLLKFVKINLKSILSLLSQMNIVINVHQPYVTMTWMKILTPETMMQINDDIDDELRLSCNTLKLKFETYGKIHVDYDSQKHSVKWTSSDENIATVDENGIVFAHRVGTAIITATLCDKNGNVIVSKDVEVITDGNMIQTMLK